MLLCGRRRAQATIELALVIPGLLLGLFLITAVGLVARADGEVAGVAVEAARAVALVASDSDGPCPGGGLRLGFGRGGGGGGC